MSYQVFSVRSLPFLLLLSLGLQQAPSSNAFITLSGPPPQAAFVRSCSTHNTKMPGSVLFAKKKRIRKDKSPSEAGGDLPDFDLDEDQSTETKSSASSSGSSGSSSDLSGDITDAMMGSTTARTRSVRELIRDRSLESKFEFEASAGADVLPDIAEMARGEALASASDMDDDMDDEASVGKKRARQEARRAAAQAMEPEPEQGSFLESIPFIQDSIRDEKGKITGVKLLEFGTWAGIYSLVAWELYLNSPLFDRVNPLIPVVYNLLP